MMSLSPSAGPYPGDGGADGLQDRSKYNAGLATAGLPMQAQLLLPVEVCPGGPGAYSYSTASQQHLQLPRQQPASLSNMMAAPRAPGSLGDTLLGQHRGLGAQHSLRTCANLGRGITSSTPVEVREEDSESDHARHGGKRPQMQGRFSGRLALKEDEKRLVEECRLLAPLLGGQGKRSDKSRLTLAKIVRGIACGAVRKHCQEREDKLNAALTRIAELESALMGADRQQEQMQLLRAELEAKDKRLAELDPDPARTASMVRMTQQQLLLRQRSTVISPDPFGSGVHIATTGGVVTRDAGVLPTRMSVPGNAGTVSTLPAATALNLHAMQPTGADMSMGLDASTGYAANNASQATMGNASHMMQMGGMPGGMSGGGSVASEQMRISTNGLPSAFNTPASGRAGGNGLTMRSSAGNVPGNSNSYNLQPGSIVQSNSVVQVGGNGPPLQSPFCINIPPGGAPSAGSLAALLAQQNAASANANQSGSAQPSADGGNGSARPSTGHLVGQADGAQAGQHRASNNSTDTRTHSENGSLQRAPSQTQQMPNFGAIKPSALSNCMTSDNNTPAAAWQAALAALQGATTDPEGNEPAGGNQEQQGIPPVSSQQQLQRLGSVDVGSKRAATEEDYNINKRTRADDNQPQDTSNANSLQAAQIPVPPPDNHQLDAAGMAVKQEQSAMGNPMDNQNVASARLVVQLTSDGVAVDDHNETGNNWSTGVSHEQVQQQQQQAMMAGQGANENSQQTGGHAPSPSLRTRPSSQPTQPLQQIDVPAPEHTSQMFEAMHAQQQQQQQHMVDQRGMAGMQGQQHDLPMAPPLRAMEGSRQDPSQNASSWMQQGGQQEMQNSAAMQAHQAHQQQSYLPTLTTIVGTPTLTTLQQQTAPVLQPIESAGQGTYMVANGASTTPYNAAAYQHQMYEPMTEMVPSSSHAVMLHHLSAERNSANMYHHQVSQQQQQQSHQNAMRQAQIEHQQGTVSMIPAGMPTEGLAFNASQGLYNLQSLAVHDAAVPQQQQMQMQMRVEAEACGEYMPHMAQHRQHQQYYSVSAPQPMMYYMANNHTAA